MRSRVVLLMGVSGCGKTTVGRALADALGWAWLEGDDLHPAANVDTMRSGQPLDDDDRAPWLDAIRERIDAVLARSDDAGLVVGCSALKTSYRRRLGTERPGVRVVHLDGSRALLAERLGSRRGHFMPAHLLDSQLETLESPHAAPRGSSVPDAALVLDVGHPPVDLVQAILDDLDDADDPEEPKP